MGDQGRNIQPLPCQDQKGTLGVCMFAWNCAEAGGTHLGTCVDRFYFGSCCQLREVIKPADLDQMTVNEVQAQPDESIAAPVKPKPTTTTTTSTTSTTTTKSSTTTVSSTTIKSTTTTTT